MLLFSSTSPLEVSAKLSWLKLAAMAAMLLDHIAAAYGFYPVHLAMLALGGSLLA